MGTVSRVHTFSSGAVLTAAQLNNEFDNLLTSSAINGGLNATNLGVTAGQITASKALVVDSSRDLDDTSASNQINNLSLSGTLKLADNKALSLGTNDDVTIQYDETTNDALEIAAAVEGAALAIVLKADQGDDAGDAWKVGVADGGALTFGNNIASAGSYVTGLTLTPHATTTSWVTAIAGQATVGSTLGVSGAITATDTTAPLILKYDAQEYVTHAVSSAGVYSITTTDASSDSGAITLDTVDSITLDSDTATEGVVYADGGTNLLRISNSSSDVIFKPLVDAKDIVIQQYDGNEVARFADNRRLYLYDEGGEYFSSDGSNLTIASGSAAWVLPASDGSANQVLKTNGSGTLSWTSVATGTIGGSTGSTDNIVLTANGTGGATVQANSAVAIDDSANISGVGTIASGAITATDTTAPLILKYDAQEYVTHAVSSAGVYSITTTDDSSDSGAITLDTVDKITLDSDTADQGIVYADGGTELMSITNSSSDVIFKPLVDAKDLVIQQYDGNEVARFADNRRFYLYDEGGEYLSSDGSALTIASGSAAWVMPTADGSANQVLKTDGSGNLDWVTSGGSYSDWAVVTTTHTASSGEQLICNHASTPFTVTLPSSPSAGNTVTIKNVGAALITIGRNSEEIDELAADGTLPRGNAVQLVFVDGSIDSWMSL